MLGGGNEWEKGDGPPGEWVVGGVRVGGWVMLECARGG